MWLPICDLEVACSEVRVKYTVMTMWLESENMEQITFSAEKLFINISRSTGSNTTSCARTILGSAFSSHKLNILFFYEWTVFDSRLIADNLS